MKLLAPAVVDLTKKLEERAYLTSWKEIAEYMRCGVRTVQRYEREFGLPVRRPTGKSRGSVIATRAEIDAWIAADSIRETFKLSRIEIDSRKEAAAKKMEAGVLQMRELKEQMLALRAETTNTLKLLVERVSDIRTHMPSSRIEGYGPLVNMETADFSFIEEGKVQPADSRRHSGKTKGLRRNYRSMSSTKKPH